MSQTIVITGAGSGFGALAARALADAGHTVYAGIRNTATRNADRVEDAAAYARDNSVDLRTIELDVSDQASVDAAIAKIVSEQKVLDVVIHNAGHMTLGPSEAFTTDEFASVFDTNVLSTQRVNLAALPHLRRQGRGLVLWVSSSSVKGGTPPYLGPYFAAKAAMDSLAVTYAGELARFGVETSIVVPGAYTSGTNHFASAGHASRTAIQDEYDVHYGGMNHQIGERLTELFPKDRDAAEVADVIVAVVDAPEGSRPFRVHIDPVNDGSEEVSVVADRVRVEFLQRFQLDDLIPSSSR